MPSHIALLRGINVGGHRRVPMAELRMLAQEIGFRIGLAFVLVLMLFAAWNDILNLGASLSQRGT